MTGTDTSGPAVAEYQHHQAGLIHAVPVSAPASADWAAVKADAGTVLGHVVDTRADAGGEPSPVMPADDDARPFDSFDRGGRYITSTHSLRGALLAIGNRAS